MVPIGTYQYDYKSIWLGIVAYQIEKKNPRGIA
jgi:hypothetical protein